MTFAQYAEFAVVVGFGLGLAFTSLRFVIWANSFVQADGDSQAVPRG